MQGTLQLSVLPPLALYVHVPWCLKKCPYCDFNSHAVQGSGIPEEPYITALIADLEQALPLVWGRPVHSVFIGGGTPSLLSASALDRLLGAVRARLPLQPGCEITLEANPGTFERNRFRAFRSAGITRLSVGVQSFNDTHLRALGRVHDGAQARAALTEAADVFDTFNLDLMYALPGQTVGELEQDMRTALSFAPPHLSIYHLSVEPNTVFAKYPPTLPAEDDAYAMLDLIGERTAAADLQRYEVSAFAHQGHRCQHNLNYWQFGDYLGLGAGAHGKISFPHRVLRQQRWRDPVRYMDETLRGTPLAEEREVTRGELPFEFMLNALRLREGFPLAWFTERTGLPPSAIERGLALAEARGLIERDLTQVRPSVQGFDFLSDLQELFLNDE